MKNLTQFSALGGCSCKLSANQLEELLRGLNAKDLFAKEAADDDAAFSYLQNGDVLVSSVDFQNPIVDDPYLAGKIGGLNAVSDIFACGVQPLWAEVILAVPDIAPDEQVATGGEMMRGIVEACSEVGCQVIGGHTIVQPTPLLGLAVRGVANPDQIKRKSGAKPGDVVLTTKPIGNGIAVAARQVGFLTDPDWNTAEQALLRANSIGGLFGEMKAISSLTDITGFGLVGHALEVARSSNVTIELDLTTIPALPGVKRAAESGFVPQLAADNWAFAQDQVKGAETLSEGEKMFLADPQTNGGLLVTVANAAAATVIKAALQHGVEAIVIGEVREFDTHYFCVTKVTT